MIKKSRSPNRLHIGGMWKVAYADFITAMMALFMLLWVLNSVPKESLHGVAQYFSQSQNPSALSLEQKEEPGNVLRAFSEISNLSNETDRYNFMNIINTLQHDEELKDFSDNLLFDLTNEGLRIQIMDSESRPMFHPNTDRIAPYMSKILLVVGSMLKSVPNYLAIYGHTASIRDPSLDSTVDLWDLSVSRSNEVRKFFTKILNQDQIVKVVGVADKEPYRYNDPYSVQNIRISVILLNQASINRFQKNDSDMIFR